MLFSSLVAAQQNISLPPLQSQSSVPSDAQLFGLHPALVVIPEEAFLEAVETGGFAPSDPALESFAREVAGQLADPQAEGLLAEYVEGDGTPSIPFAGDTFIVVREAWRFQSLDPSGAPDGPVQVEASQFYVVSISLSGLSTWVGQYPALFFDAASLIGTHACCAGVYPSCVEWPAGTLGTQCTLVSDPSCLPPTGTNLAIVETPVAEPMLKSFSCQDCTDTSCNAPPPAASLLDEEHDLFPLNATLVVIPEEVFLQHLDAGDYTPPSPESLTAARQLALEVRSANTRGLIAEYTTSPSGADVTFEGDMFLVAREGWTTQPIESGGAPGAPPLFESSKYYVAATTLSGMSPWVGRYPALVLRPGTGGAPYTDCCGTEPLDCEDTLTVPMSPGELPFTPTDPEGCGGPDFDCPPDFEGFDLVIGETPEPGQTGRTERQNCPDCSLFLCLPDGPPAGGDPNDAGGPGDDGCLSRALALPNHCSLFMGQDQVPAECRGECSLCDSFLNGCAGPSGLLGGPPIQGPPGQPCSTTEAPGICALIQPDQGSNICDPWGDDLWQGCGAGCEQGRRSC